MTTTVEVRGGGCHCGAVRFEARLGTGFDSVRRCTCSYCRMRGAVIVTVDAGDFTITAGQALLTTYRFHTGVAQHCFCSRCGIGTHLRRRSDPTRWGVNVACLDGASPFQFTEVPVSDGIDHPGDTGRPARLAGILRYIPAG